MIGLGSNRLTVCRRGGMSVTQAGKGGMEWLAGGRLPLWAQWWLPYSRQAGEALKAQFPTQLPTIRDYGFAHPEIVGYMNAYAVEDPKIAYSLVPTIGYRWLISSGSQYVDTGIYNPNGFHLKAQAYIISNDNQFSPIACMSNTPSDNQRNYFGVDSAGRYWAGWGQYEYNQGTASLDAAEWEFNSLQSSSDKSMKRNGETIFSIGSNTYRSDSSITNVMLFGRVTGGSLARHWHGGIGTATFYNASGEVIAIFAPFIRGGVNGMIELISGDFKTPTGGSMTISEAPAS